MSNESERNDKPTFIKMKSELRAKLRDAILRTGATSVTEALRHATGLYLAIASTLRFGTLLDVSRVRLDTTATSLSVIIPIRPGTLHLVPRTEEVDLTR
ncbi:MAG: hypothetical protein RLZZ324_325 [Candidatus Parcubacteria bacterium]|jgi:hypothetical protein